jgi:hypothetical protein
MQKGLPEALLEQTLRSLSLLRFCERVEAEAAQDRIGVGAGIGRGENARDGIVGLEAREVLGGRVLECLEDGRGGRALGGVAEEVGGELACRSAGPAGVGGGSRGLGAHVG